MTKRGLVLGKFLPPHQGHLFLMEFAQRCVDELAVVVGTLSNEPIPGSLRHAWVSELLPTANVLHLSDENPQAPHEHPDFWNIWERSLRRILPWEPNYLFASEEYGAKLASIWNAQFVPVDIQRRTISISGSAIRQAPLQHWQYLPRCVRPWYVKRISLFGPESTGKTTLANELADHFNTTLVPEYARQHLLAQQGHVSLPDMLPIAERQVAAEDALARSANRLLICDTDPLLTSLWSEALFNQVPEAVAAIGMGRPYDLTICTDIDIPFEADPVRYLPERRRWFMEACKQTLTKNNRRFIIVRGSRAQRRAQAIEQITALLQDEAL